MFGARQRLVLLLIAGLCLDAYGAPVEEQQEETNPQLTAGYFQGDMDVEFQRNGLKAPARHWPDATVYYKIDKGFNKRQIDHIELTIRRIGYVSCIKFVHATPKTKNYVLITGSDTECYSASVGFQGGEQRIYLLRTPVETACFRLGEIEHQLLQTLGFIEQHRSPDRDKYIKINFNNMISGHDKYFAKYGANEVDNFGIEYDYGSIMHNSRWFHTKNGNPTFVALKPEGQLKMGQRYAMTKGDIIALNKMYKCPGKIY